MIQKIIAALFCGVLITIVFLHQDPWFKNRVGELVKNAFEQSGSCIMQGNVRSLNILGPTIEFEDVIVTPKDGSSCWQWKACTFAMSCSWLQVFCFGSLDMNLVLEDMQATTQLHKGHLAIMEHVIAILNAPVTSIPLFIKNVHFQRSKVVMRDEANDTTTILHWHSESKRIEQGMKTHVYFLDGQISKNNIDYLKKLEGQAHVDVFSDKRGLDIVATIDGSLVLPQLAYGSSTCYIAGLWDRDHGQFTLANADRTIVVDPISVTGGMHGMVAEITMNAPLTYLWHLVNGGTSSVTIDGQASMRFTTQLWPTVEPLDCCVTVNNARYGTVLFGQECIVKGAKQENEWKGTVTARHDSGRQFDGTWSWDIGKQCGQLMADNANTFSLPLARSWQILPHACSLRAYYDIGQQQGRAHYVCKAQHAFLPDAVITSSGYAKLDGTMFGVYGNIQDYTYTIAGTTQSTTQIMSVQLCDQQKKNVLSFVAQNPRNLTGFITIPLLQGIAQNNGLTLQGDGRIDMNITLGDTLNVDMRFVDGTLRLPYTYTLINGFEGSCSIDFDRQQLVFDKVRCLLARGSLDCIHGIINFDADYAVLYAYMPVLFNRCFFNIASDLFALVSGRLLFIKQAYDKPIIKGNLIVDNAHIKENILSQAFQEFFGSAFASQRSDLMGDITIETGVPMYVKTAFLETYAKAHIIMRNKLQSPDISGTVSLTSGSLFFPYRPLHITKGNLYFVQGQTDPLIELVAKNKIKKYNITLTVTGSVTSPHVMLESAPSLTEEQIIALLLAGSQEESLNIAAPALIMQNITNLIVGKAQAPAKLDTYFKKLFKPLKNVHLVPSFTDQTGRGGLRGAIEVDVGEHWHALIQKNFSLPEDTRFELEYQVSDDVTVRGIRDERRDLGGEVEVRWKF